MRLAGKRSWSIAVDEPQRLLIALFVRDAAGLRPGTDPVIPALTPTVALDPALASAAGRTASRQWARWWTSLLDAEHPAATPPDFPELGDSPDLRQILRGCFPDAVRWSSSRKREHITLIRSKRPRVENEVVSDVERSRERPARPFELRITELPVATAHAWRAGPQHLIVTRSLLADPPAYREQLRTIVEELA